MASTSSNEMDPPFKTLLIEELRSEIWETVVRLSFKSHMEKRALEFSFCGGSDASYEDVSGTFSPTNEVNPRMIVTDFYSGGMVAYSTEGYDPLLTEECRTEPKGRKIQIENLFDKNGDKKPPCHVTLVGPAGSGKTTLLQRFARNFIRSHVNEEEEILFILHGKNYVTGGTHGDRETTEKNLESRRPADQVSNEAIPEEIELTNFLFDVEGGNIGRLWIKWMMENSKKITFLIDSLDTLPFKLIGQHPTVSNNDKASPATFLYNIMTGSLFPDSRVLSSAREYAITEYEGDLRAERIVALVGLSEESREKHIHFVLGPDEAAAFISDLRRKYPGLWALCSTPVFLNFTLIGHLKKEDKLSFMPSTMTGVVANLLQNLLRSKHASTSSDEEPNRVEIIDRLKKLSYEGIKNKKVTFGVRDLEEAKLTQEMVGTLSISVPGRNYRILKGENLMFFCHQSIEEILSALYVLQMEMDGFTAFLDTELNKPENSIVRRFISGLLLHEEVHAHAIRSDLLRGQRTSFDGKRVKLIQVITDQMKKKRVSKAEKMELYITLHEAGQGSKTCVHTILKSIDLVGNPMRPSDMHAIATTVNHCKVLRRFDISDCDVTSENLDALLYCLDGAGVKVKELAMKNSHKLEIEGFRKLGAITKECQVDILELDGCNITPGEMQAFCESLDAFQIDCLTLKDYNSNNHVTEEMLTAIKGLLPKVTSTLDLDGWIVSDGGNKMIRSELQKMKDRDKAFKLRVLCGDEGGVTIEAEDLMDAYENAIKRVPEFKTFARVKRGLGLDESVVSETDEDYRFGPHEKKIRLLRAWAGKKGAAATATLLNETVDRFFSYESQD